MSWILCSGLVGGYGLGLFDKAGVVLFLKQEGGIDSLDAPAGIRRCDTAPGNGCCSGCLERRRMQFLLLRRLKEHSRPQRAGLAGGSAARGAQAHHSPACCARQCRSSNLPEFQFRHGGGFFNAILLPGKPAEREEDEFWSWVVG
jgi:hypothetical protein